MIRFQTRTTPAYLGRYIRALPTSSRLYLHYAQGGVGSLARTLRLRCRSGVFHRRAAPLRRLFPAVTSSSASSLLLFSSGCPFFPRSAAGHRSGSSFILVYVFYTSTCPTGSLAVGWVLPHSDAVSLLRSFTVLWLRFEVLFLNRGCLVDSRRRQWARTTRPGTRRSRCSTKGRYSPPRFTTSRHDAISLKAVTLWNRGFICCSLLGILFSGLRLFSFLPRFSLSLCSLFFCVRCRWFVGLLCALLCVGCSYDD